MSNRSALMATVKGENTKPEMLVRSILHRSGYRYKLHVKDLPGRPDIVLPKYGLAIFVNGCFWHQHNCKKGQTLPKTNEKFWKTKLSRNVERDANNQELLKKQGWKVIVIWECQIKNLKSLIEILSEHLPNVKVMLM
jgi:DNA mismatch endonuclease (patch repair protein)